MFRPCRRGPVFVIADGRRRSLLSSATAVGTQKGTTVLETPETAAETIADGLVGRLAQVVQGDHS